MCCFHPEKLTQQGEGDAKDEHHDAAAQRQHEVAGAHHRGDEQAGVLPLEVLDDRLVLPGPHGAHEDQGHHGPAQEHAERIKEPSGESVGKRRNAGGGR